MIKVKQGDITRESCDAIVNPSNSHGTMGGGVALAIKRAAGPEIESEAELKSPIPVGSAIITRGWKLPCRFVIHASTMKEPAQEIPVENVSKAVEAALKLAESEGLKSVALSGLGAGVGKIPFRDVAKAIVKEAKKHKNIQITLIDLEKQMVDCFKKALKTV